MYNIYISRYIYIYHVFIIFLVKKYSTASMGAQHRQLKLEAKMPRWVDIGGVPETLYQG